MSENLVVLVVGEYSSGKRTFVETFCGRRLDLAEIAENSISPAISGKRFSLDSLPNTLLVEAGIYEITDSDSLYFLIPPENRRFDIMWSLIGEGSDFTFLGSLVLIDSRYPQFFREAISILDTLVAYTTQPVIGAANRQNFSDAFTAEDLQILYSRNQSRTFFLPCVATDLESVKGVTIRLLEEYLNTISD